MRAYVSRGLLVAALFAHTQAILAQVPSGSGYHAAYETILGGEGGWDYLTLDANGLRLYISRSTHVSVVDPESRKEVGAISDTPGVHGVALAPDLGKGYTSNGRDASVTVFDLRTLRQLSRISVGASPDAIVYEPVTRRVFTFRGPTGLAMDVAQKHLFVGCSNRLMAIVDAGHGRVLATLPLGAGCDATAFDPRGGLAFAANGDGSLTVIREDGPGNFVVVENVKTKPGARTMALDSQRQRIYLVTAEYGPKPPATNDKPNPRPPIIPGSFTMLTLTR